MYDYINVAQTGFVAITSVPQGAEIYVDDIDQNLVTPSETVPILIPLTGSHTIRLTLRGFQDLFQNINVSENQTIQISAVLVPMEGCVYFDSNPQGAEIYIGDSLSTLIDYHSKTPTSICGLTPATYAFKLSKIGYNDITGAFSLGISQGEIVRRNLLSRISQSSSSLPLILIGIGLAGLTAYVLYSRR